MRFKNRYILIQITRHLPSTAVVDNKNNNPQNNKSTKDLVLSSTQTLSRLLRSQIQLHFGDAGAAWTQSNTNVKYFNPYTGVGIIRCAREVCEMVSAVLVLCVFKSGGLLLLYDYTLTDQSSLDQVKVQILHTSGNFKVKNNLNNINKEQ